MNQNLHFNIFKVTNNLLIVVCLPWQYDTSPTQGWGKVPVGARSWARLGQGWGKVGARLGQGWGNSLNNSL